MNILVTGGGGFLGSAIARMLTGNGHRVRSFSRGEYPQLQAAGIDTFRGEINDPHALRRAAENCDAVIHTAAKAGVWGAVEEYERINVRGTDTVIQICRDLQIPRLVYTSSPSVVFNGEDEDGIDETAPYAHRWLAHYPRSKALAEQAVLAANDTQLATVALRPHLIWGPGDPHLVPRIVTRARAGKLALLGDGSKRVDSTYIDNAAEAHVLALQALSPAAACAGKPYFISNGEPLAMAQLLNNILAAAQLPPISKHLNPHLAYAAGAVLEMVHRGLGLNSEPLMTRFVARQLSTHHWFRLNRAREDFGYQPRISLAEGFQHLRSALHG